MHCHNCGGSYVEVRGPLVMSDDCVGLYTVEAENYLRCSECDDVLLSAILAEKADQERKRKLIELLQRKPLEAFVTSTQAAAILGISRQALHKHRRIARGFIHQTDFGGQVVYLRESVELFAETGDGRLPLELRMSEIEYLPPRSQGRSQPLGEWREPAQTRPFHPDANTWIPVLDTDLVKEEVYA